MKNCIYFLLVLFLISANKVLSQNVKEFIILNSGDTVFAEIKKNCKYTNKNKVSYIDEYSGIKTLTPYETEGYFDGEVFFISEKVKNDKPVFLNYFADGFCKIGETVNNDGKVYFYLFNSKELIPLNGYEHNPAEILRKYLSEFDAFIKTYDKKIKYDRKSLGEFITAYNEFMYPEIYKKTKFKNKEYFNFSIDILPYNYGFSTKNSDIQLKGFRLFKTDISVINKFSYGFSLITSAGFQFNNYVYDWMLFNYTSWTLSEKASFLVSEKQKLKILFVPEASLSYNYPLTENINPNSVFYENFYTAHFGTNISANFILDFKKNTGIITGLGLSSVKTIKQGIMSKPVYLKSRIFVLNIGFFYKVKKI